MERIDRRLVSPALEGADDYGMNLLRLQADLYFDARQLCIAQNLQ
ncbi:MAG: hypothetical protein AB2805_03375 [Candidatus Thiodiazotropha sp.]